MEPSAPSNDLRPPSSVRLIKLLESLPISFPAASAWHAPCESSANIPKPFPNQPRPSMSPGIDPSSREDSDQQTK